MENGKMFFFLLLKQKEKGKEEEEEKKRVSFFLLLLLSFLVIIKIKFYDLSFYTAFGSFSLHRYPRRYASAFIYIFFFSVLSPISCMCTWETVLK